MDFRKEDFYVEINKNSNEAWDSANDELSDIITRGETNGQTPEELLTELQEQFIEMGQLKSDFDVEKFTVKKEGNFLCHNFHFLMRQYSLTVTEMRRMLLEREEKRRTAVKYQKMMDEGETMVPVLREHASGAEEFYGTEDVWLDLEQARIWNQIKALEVTMTNKIAMIRKFEECRKELIRQNGGKTFTNAEYQAETPKYWKWFFERLVLRQIKAHATGISTGTWENIDMLERTALINPEFQVKMLNDDGMFDMKQLELDSELEKQLSEPRIRKLLEAIEKDKSDPGVPESELK